MLTYFDFPPKPGWNPQAKSVLQLTLKYCSPKVFVAESLLHAPYPIAEFTGSDSTSPPAWHLSNAPCCCYH